MQTNGFTFYLFYRACGQMYRLQDPHSDENGQGNRRHAARLRRLRQYPFFNPCGCSDGVWFELNQQALAPPPTCKPLTLLLLTLTFRHGPGGRHGIVS